MENKEYTENFKIPKMEEAYLEEIKSPFIHDPFSNLETQEHIRINLERVLKPIPNVTPRHINILKRYYGVDCEPESVEQIRKTAGLHGESVSKTKIYQIIESSIYHLKKHVGRDKTKSYMAYPN